MSAKSREGFDHGKVQEETARDELDHEVLESGHDSQEPEWQKN